MFSLISTGRQVGCSELSDWPFELSRVLTITVGWAVASLAHIANSSVGVVQVHKDSVLGANLITSAYTLGVTVRSVAQRRDQLMSPSHSVVHGCCSITLCGLGAASIDYLVSMRLSMGMWWYSSHMHWMATHHHISMDCSSHYLGILPIF